MNPLKLHMKNFMCYEDTELDFTQFSSALIIGRIEGNDIFSNNVGKTTIFKAIEYALFNKSTFSLDRVVRDETNECCVSFEFTADKNTYKVVRSRTKKGTNDLSLFKMNNDWEDISGRRVTDTEKMLSDIIKTNYTSFRSTVHFVQKDVSGLATVTPEKRKSILKEALQLIIYSKLEKFAKDKYAILQKDFNKIKISSDLLGNPKDKIANININLHNLKNALSKKQSEIDNLQKQNEDLLQQIKEIENKISDKIKEIDFLNASSESLSREIVTLHDAIEKLNKEKGKLLLDSKCISEQLKSIIESKNELQKLDVDTNITSLNKELVVLRDKSSETHANINSIKNKIQELSIPLPDDNYCKHCRQQLSAIHKDICKANIDKEISDLNSSLVSLKSYALSLQKEEEQKKKDLLAFECTKSKLLKLEQQVKDLVRDLDSKKQMFEAYKDLLSKNESIINQKRQELKEVRGKLLTFDFIAYNTQILKELSCKQNALQNNINYLVKEKSGIETEIAIQNYALDTANKDCLKLEEYKKQLDVLGNELEYYPNVIEAFGSYGITNLIIQNVLDDLQIEANNLLNQLRPGIQLSFVIEKTKNDGSQDETLDIIYYVNGKEREFEQIGGAAHLSIQFALRIGLFIILQKVLGTDIRLLLLDEIDQPFDKAGVDALSDMIKIFQKDFTILVITHNDRLKDKFAHYIVVDQDSNMVSKISQYNN